MDCRGQELGREAHEEDVHCLRDLVTAETEPSTCGGQTHQDHSPAEAPDGPSLQSHGIGANK